MSKKYKKVLVLRVSKAPPKYVVEVNMRNLITKYIAQDLQEALNRAYDLVAPEGMIFVEGDKKVGEEVWIGLIDLAKCSDATKENLKWLAIAAYLEGKTCPVCGRGWDSRQDVVDREPRFGYDDDVVVCSQCWREYEERRRAK